MDLFTKQTHIVTCELPWLPKGRLKNGINWEFEINRYTLLYIKQIYNKDPLYKTGNYTQYLAIICNGKESEKVLIHIYVYQFEPL